MDYLSSLSTTIGFVVLVLFVRLRYRTAFPTLFGPNAPAEAELESSNGTRGDLPSRDPDYYYQSTTIVLRVHFLHPGFDQNHLDLHGSCLDPGYTLSRARRLLAL